MVINWQPLQLLSVGRVVFYHVDKEPKTLGGREGGERGRRGREDKKHAGCMSYRINKTLQVKLLENCSKL